MTDLEFHATLRDTFADLQDGHTCYRLPAPCCGLVASLGFLLERCWDGATPIWVASHVSAALIGKRSQLVAGAEITRWNGMPIAVAVAHNADREWGSNPPARLARGVESMTQRSLVGSAIPDEDWIELEFTVDGTSHVARLHWRIPFAESLLLNPMSDDEPPRPVHSERAALRRIDERAKLVQEVKKALFTAPGPATVEMTLSPDLRARRITTPSGTCGHLRIYNFDPEDPEAFFAEYRRLLDEMPDNGLIVDIRGNPGGDPLLAERMLQCLTPRPIRSEPVQFVNTEQTAALCRAMPPFFGFADFAPSIDEALTTGAQYSRAIPAFPAAQLNDVGQLYHGPVVLITDALCYSSADTFAAGFQDHEIGVVLGVDANTGAGGADVFSLSQLLTMWRGSPIEPLSLGADVSVALRRCLRVGPHEGKLLEDLGVVPDLTHRSTKRDLLEHNADLLAFAAGLLAKQKPRRLAVSASTKDGGRELKVTVQNLTSVDVYVNDRPVTSTSVAPGKNRIMLPTQPADARIRLEGFDVVDGIETLVAARLLRPGPSR